MATSSVERRRSRPRSGRWRRVSCSCQSKTDSTGRARKAPSVPPPSLVSWNRKNTICPKASVTIRKKNPRVRSDKAPTSERGERRRPPPPPAA